MNDPSTESDTDRSAQESDAWLSSTPIDMSDLLDRIDARRSSRGRDEPTVEEKVKTTFHDLIELIDGSEATSGHEAEDASEPTRPPEPPGEHGMQRDLQRTWERTREYVAGHDDGASSERRDERSFLSPRTLRRPREFYVMWTLALLTYGVGDVVTTGVGVFYVPAIIERNPIVDWLLQTVGMSGFVGVKLVIFLLLVEISLIGDHDGDSLGYYGPPIAAILLGVALAGWNILNIATLG